MKIGKLTAMAMAAGLCVVSADQVKLNDGSILNGKISQLVGGKVKIATAFAGEIEIAAAQVASMTTDGVVNMAADGNKFSGKLTAGGLQGEGSLVPVNYATLTALWLPGAKDPTIPEVQKRKWSYEAGLNISGKTGNSEKAEQGISLTAIMKGPEDRLKLYGSAKHARDNHQTTDEEYILGADYEHRIQESKHSWFVRSEFEHDEINDLDLSSTNALGYGYYLMDKENCKIRLRAGLSYVYKSYDSDKDSDSNVGYELGYHHEIKLKEALGFKNLGDLVTDLTFTPSFDDVHDYRVLHDSAISIPLGGSKYWALRLGVNNDYYSKVAEDKDRLDTTYYAKLILKWE